MEVLHVYNDPDHSQIHREDPLDSRTWIVEASRNKYVAIVMVQSFFNTTLIAIGANCYIEPVAIVPYSIVHPPTQYQVPVLTSASTSTCHNVNNLVDVTTRSPLYPLPS